MLPPFMRRGMRNYERMPFHLLVLPLILVQVGQPKQIREKKNLRKVQFSSAAQRKPIRGEN